MTKDECAERNEMIEEGKGMMYTCDRFPITERDRERKKERKKNRFQTDVISPPMKQFRNEIDP